MLEGGDGFLGGLGSLGGFGSLAGLSCPPHPGTFSGQSQTPIAGLKAVPGAHGIV